MNQASKVIQEANGCTMKAWEAEVDAFAGVVFINELDDVRPPKAVALIHKAITAHRDAILLLEAALPSRRQSK